MAEARELEELQERVILLGVSLQDDRELTCYSCPRCICDQSMHWAEHTEYNRFVPGCWPQLLQKSRQLLHQASHKLAGKASGESK